jgi:hypothetical protein
VRPELEDLIMPQAWPAVVAFTKWLVSAKTFGAFIARIVVMTVLSAGLGRLLARKGGPGLTNGNPLDLRVDSMAPHRIIYGERGVGGVLRFRHSMGTDNAYAYLILVWAAHECEAITSFRADGVPVSFDGEGNATGNFAGVMHVTHHLGAHDQEADAYFVSKLGGLGLWTADHRLQGRCYSAIELKYDQAKYPGGIPQFTAVVKGKKVFDWRDVEQDVADYSTWKWSDNPMLCAADFLRGCPVLDGAGVLIRPWGIGCSEDQLPAARWIAEANACDELVALAGGGTEKRYTCNGCFDADAPPPNVLDALAGSAAGKIVPTGAEFIPYAGVWHAPDFTLTKDMLRDEPSASNPLPRPDRLNLVKGTFINPAANYQADDFPQVVLTDFIEEDGAELARDLDLMFTTSPTMARRIAKIGALRSRQGLVTSWPCNLRALPAMAGENVVVELDEFGWAGKAFEVTEFTLSLQRAADGGMGFVPDVVLQESDPSIFDWSTAEEGTADAAPNTGAVDIRDVPTPAGVVVTNSNIVQPDGTVVPRVKVTWDLPTNPWVLRAGFAHVEYKRTADVAWLIWNARLRGDANLEYILDVQAGDEVQVRVRFENYYRVPGPYCAPVAITVGSDVTGPAAPTGLAAAPAPGGIRLSWADNTTDDDFDYFRVYRRLASAANDIAGATQVFAGRVTDWTDVIVTVGTEYRYWVRGVDQSGNLSAPSDPVVGAAAVAAGVWIDVRFKASATLPDTPTDPIPAGWSDGPVASALPNWVTRAQKDASGALVGTWSTPVQITGPDGQDGEDGADGEDGDSLEVEYSVTGSGSWHFPFETGDKWMRQRLTGGEWSLAIKIVGEDGEPGAPGEPGPGTDTAPTPDITPYGGIPYEGFTIDAPSGAPSGYYVQVGPAGGNMGAPLTGFPFNAAVAYGDTIVVMAGAPGYLPSAPEYVYNDGGI